jgi:60 kDa SS-A/Ro ribonucleoprotein
MSRKFQKIGGSVRHNPYKTADATNLAGFPAWKKDIKASLIQVLYTGTFENSFYADANQLTKEAVDIFETAKVEDMEEWIPKARNEGFMRSSPILALTILFERDTQVAKKIFHKTILTGNDLTAFIDARKARGRGFGRALKTSIKLFLGDKLNEYYAIKYGNDLKHGIRLARPSPKEIGTTIVHLIDYLMRGEFNEDEFQKILAFETLKEIIGNDVKENVINNTIRMGRLDYSVVEGIFNGAKVKIPQTVWLTLAQDMGVFAFIRHLVTFERNGLEDAILPIAQEKITVANLKGAKVMPFRLYQAYNMVTSQKLKTVLADVMNDYVTQYDFSAWGKVVICPDISGSMGTHFAKSKVSAKVIAGMFSAILYKGIKESTIIPWSDRVHPWLVPAKSSSLVDIAEKISSETGNTTMEAPIIYILDGEPAMSRRSRRPSETYLYWRGETPVPTGPKKAPKEYDTLVFITDTQEWSGEGWLGYWEKYKKMFPKAKAILIRIDSYSTKPYPSEKAKALSIYEVYGFNDSVFSYLNFVFGKPAEKEDTD